MVDRPGVLDAPRGASGAALDDSAPTDVAGSSRSSARLWPPRRSAQHAHAIAPEMRRVRGQAGPWSDVPGPLDDLDLSTVRWATESEMALLVDDPGWVDAVAARAHARALDGNRGASHGFIAPVLIDAVVGMSLHHHGADELTRAAEWIARERMNHDVMLVNVIAELESRGVEPPHGLSRVDWLRQHDPSLTAGAARAIVRVGAAVAESQWGRLRMLVTTQQVTVAHAAQIIEFRERTIPVADPDDLTAALGDLQEQATRLRPEELATLVRQHTEQIRPHPNHATDDDARDEGRRRARGLWFSQPNATGMVGMRGVLDPEAAAILKSAIDPLSMPCPAKDERGPTLAPDPRTPARRRMEALLDVVARGVSSPDGVPTTDRAKVVVLIDHDTLTGRVRGTGRSLTGDVLSAATVRRIACDAGVIPMVLGTDSAPLDLGRDSRLVSRSLRLALTVRDKGCSFPGCSMPPAWTDAHHVTHWVRGGSTSLLTTALLCRRHHTHVHRHDLTATVTATSVTWHQ